MSDVSQGPGWWQASDGKWYPPADADRPAPGWWLASDGNWYPPEAAPPPGPAVRTPVKPVAKPVKPVAKPVEPVKPVKPVAEPVEPVAEPVEPVARSVAESVQPTARPVEPVTSVSAAPVTPVDPPADPVTPATEPAATRTSVSASPSRGPVAAPAGPSSPARAAGSSPPPVATPAGPAATTPGPAPRGADAGPGTPPGPAVVPVRSAPSPGSQIRARDEQSRRDAEVLLAARRSAASRALGNLSALIDLDEPRPSRAPTTSSTAGAAAPSPSTAPSPRAPSPRSAASPPAPKTKGKVGRVPAADPAPPRPSEPPLLEVKQGTLAADIEHIGERLVIFNDRVELHDRNDRVRQVIAGGDIADVVVHKKFTGSTVTVESGTGERIVAKGLKPEQADEIRSVILKRSRSGASTASEPTPARRSGAPSGSADTVVDARTSPAERSLGPADARELMVALENLHRAGVLSDAELLEKQALVQRIADGDTLAATIPSR